MGSSRTPPPQSFALVSFPSSSILLVVFNRPTSLNCMPTTAQYELEELFQWYDYEPSLRCAIVTGAGRAFCAGQDLKEWNKRKQDKVPESKPMMPKSGFGALSRRHGKKPVIGAVNGLAFGGGLEIVANLDLVVAARNATFALPEVKRGVAALAGSLPRLARIIGKQRTMELALTGRTFTAEEARLWGLVNTVTEESDPDEEILQRPVVRKALELANSICENSPDSVIVSRAGVASSWEDGSAENATRLVSEAWRIPLEDGDNAKEGLKAFKEKRAPKWLDSKL